LETFEEPIQFFNRTSPDGIGGKAVHAVVRSAKRAGSVFAFEVVAVGLLRPAQRSGPNEVRQFFLTEEIPDWHNHLQKRYALVGPSYLTLAMHRVLEPMQIRRFRHYSCRSAFCGSTRKTRRAGIAAANSVISKRVNGKSPNNNG